LFFITELIVFYHRIKRISRIIFIQILFCEQNSNLNEYKQFFYHRIKRISRIIFIQILFCEQNSNLSELYHRINFFYHRIKRISRIFFQILFCEQNSNLSEFLEVTVIICFEYELHEKH